MQLFSVISPGAYTTVQDHGRYGYQQMGIPITGALDRFAFQVANLLVGNERQCAVLEMTLTGPVLEVQEAADVAVTGADIGVTLNKMEMGCWRSFRVQPGDSLKIHQVKKGCRAYLAVSGGIDVPLVMGSRSTYVGGKIGGYSGRPLKAGDMLKAFPEKLLPKQRQLPTDYLPHYPDKIKLRAVMGPQDDFFRDSVDVLFESEFMVSPKADRMGYRLMGPKVAIDKDKPKSIVSEPSMPGGIQIPADEQPIVLLVEQTVGGYAKIATVVSTDIPKIAQTTPGDTIRFQKIDLKTAHTLYQEEIKIIRIIGDLL